MGEVDYRFGRRGSISIRMNDNTSQYFKPGKCLR
jgi:hypothetical protein